MKKYTFFLSLVLTSSYIVCAEAEVELAVKTSFALKLLPYAKLTVRALITEGKIKYSMENLENIADYYKDDRLYFAAILDLYEQKGSLTPSVGCEKADPMLFENYASIQDIVKTLEEQELVSWLKDFKDIPTTTKLTDTVIQYQATTDLTDTLTGYQAVPVTKK